MTADGLARVAGNGEQSSVLYEIEVDGKPDHSPVYWSNSTGPDPQVATVRAASVPARPHLARHPT